MKLTTEQKINLLILAGFEPMCNGGDSCPRIVRLGHAILLRNLDLFASPQNWKLFPFKGSPTDPSSYQASSWDRVKPETVPDELIYQAIETTG